MIQIQQHGSVIAIRMARTFLGRPLYWTTAYWLDGLLIDSGPPCLADALMRVLDGTPVEQIAVTHAHEDHIGGLYNLRRQYPDVPICASPQAIPVIEEPSRLGQQLYRRLLWGTPKPLSGVEPLPLYLETGKYRLRVVETPGHSRDHVSFFEPTQRWLFSGDSFIGGKERAWPAESNMFGIVSSLHTLAALRPEKLFPGSGNVRQKAQPEIHGKIAQLLGLCRDVGRLDAVGLSPEEIVEKALGEQGPRARWAQFWTQGHFSALNLIHACLTYNEIFVLGEDAGQSISSSLARRQRLDTSDSSTSQSADHGDVHSAQ